MYGSHLSIAGSLAGALLEAERLGLDTVQIFTKNQQQWKVRPLEPSAVRDWRTESARLGWNDRTAAHASYLINLASVDDGLHARSVDLMTEEVQRCETLGIPFLVHHPGSHVGADLETGLARIVSGYTQLFARTRGYRTVSCLEGTVGAGNLIGGPFEHLGSLRARIGEATGEPGRVGFCLDTCHMHAFGYDMSASASAERAFAEFDRVCGLKNLKVLHVNDSKGACGSRLDRHEHIGEGTIGARLKESGFSYIARAVKFRKIPKILETPKGKDGTGTDWDTINVRRLRGCGTSERPASRGARSRAR